LATRDRDLRTVQGGYTALDDRMLVLDFQAGEPEAFVEIHRRYGGLARHVCRRFLPNDQDVEEAFQETMIRVFQGLYRFNGRYALQPWIARIATNVSLDLIRGRARRPHTDGESVDEHEREDTGETPEEAYERLVQRDLVLAVLSDLPQPHQRALVMREFDGRSHREIAEALDMTPAQAKALIHRAKVNFRRRWLQRAAERGGLTGVALLPILWLGKIGDGFRRLVTHGGAVAHTGADAVSTAAISTSAVGVGEKIVAASLTILVAGGVTVGATRMARDRGNERTASEAPVAVVAPPSPEAPSSVSVVPVPAPEDDGKGRDRPRQAEDPKPAPEASPSPSAVVTEPSPSESPSPSPTEDPTSTPSPEPSEDPSPEPPPPPPPPPAWEGAFRASVASDEDCDCAPGLSLGGNAWSGTIEEGLAYRQAVSGGLQDAQGDAAWRVTAEYWGTLTGAHGNLGFEFHVATSAGQYDYSGAATAVRRTPLPGDGFRYVLEGSYQMESGEEGSEPPVGASGGFTVQLDVWSDGATIVGTDIVLRP
jgi:RNA polymerase sigma-70 factor (ECF subfamily)